MRRMLVLLLLLAVFAGTLAAGACRGGPSKAAMDAARIEQVRENLYMITGSGLENPGTFSGGNVGVFPALRVMHTGDMFAWKDAPYLDLDNGGSGLEYAKTVGRALDTVKDVDTLIVGHSPLRTVPELREYQQFMIDFVAAVQAAKIAGKSATEATREIDLSGRYQGYKKELYGDAVQALYTELK